MASVWALSVLALSSITAALPQKFDTRASQIVGGTEAAAGEVRLTCFYQMLSFEHGSEHPGALLRAGTNIKLVEFVSPTF